jgi:hypothetical protein
MNHHAVFAPLVGCSGGLARRPREAASHEWLCNDELDRTNRSRQHDTGTVTV